MKKAKAARYYVLFGHDLDDPEKVGYFSNTLKITDDADCAKVFPDINVNRVKGFGPPEAWRDFINSDPELNHNFKFHLVRTTVPEQH